MKRSPRQEIAHEEYDNSSCYDIINNTSTSNSKLNDNDNNNSNLIPIILALISSSDRRYEIILMIIAVIGDRARATCGRVADAGPEDPPLRSRSRVVQYTYIYIYIHISL